jgi:hypothetical protein
MIKMSNPSKKRKIGDEHRVYHQRWESDYKHKQEASVCTFYAY